MLPVVVPVALPAGVEATIKEHTLTVKGPKGTLSRQIPEGLEVVKEGNSLVIKRKREERAIKALHGLQRVLVSNMVCGVSSGFSKVLELSGVGYRAAKAGSKLSLQIGFSHPVEIDPPPGISFELEGQTKIKINGIDRELVGLVAAKIRAIRQVEPYKGKGIMYLGEQVRRKAGKAAAAKGAGATAG